MDAIFGLPRKKSAGDSVRAPLHGHIYFHDQAMVNECIENSSQQKLRPQKVLSTLVVIIYYSEQGCNDFLAGNMIRSASRYKALDETALFGCVCRHEFPIRFFNLKHGERYLLHLLLLFRFECFSPKVVICACNGAVALPAVLY